jgi:pectin methylesterase-like acyl-CoA thioesterase
LSNQDYLTTVGIIYVKQDGSGDFTTIQAAIDAAIDDHTIIVATGTYTGNGNRDCDFKAKAITVRGETGDPNDCVINCQGDPNNPHRGFKFISGEGANSVLEAVTITNGYGPKEDAHTGGVLRPAGGAIYCKESSPTIKNCIIINNSVCENTDVFSNGGGICNSYGSPLISDCIISNNLASDGGGIYNNYGSMLVINCTINDNTAKWGGGMYNYYANPTLSYCLFSGNSAAGGGMFNHYYAYPKLDNCVFTNNSDCGIMTYTYTCPTLVNCTLINNSVAGLEVVAPFSGTNSRAILKNCILWGNQLNQIIILRDSQATAEAIVSYSNIQGGWTGPGNINQNPSLVNSYHLDTNSPCIDTGDPNYIAEANQTDIDGDPRVVFGQIDMGVDEVYSDDSSLIILSKSEINFIAMGLYSNPQTDSFVIKNYGIEDLDWSTEGADECSWLGIEPANGLLQFEESENASLSINPDKANYGINSCQLLVSDADAENSPQVVTVNLDVLRPELAVSPSQFYFETFLTEPNTTGQILFIQNTGYDTLYWDINVPDGYDWLNFSIYTGQTDSNQISEVILNIDHNNIEVGHYQFDIAISDPNAGNNPQVIPVEVHALSHKGQRHVPSEYDTIQAAIDAAVDGDEVIIQRGVYTGQGNFNIDFKGKALTVRCINPHNPAVVAATIIDANNNAVAAGFDFHTGEDHNSIVDGLTITRCGWGAVSCYQSSPTIRNCIIRNNCNAPEGSGAAIACGDSTAIISNCIIKDNKGGEEGGSGILLWRANVTIANCLVTDNWSWGGGGISSYSSDALIRNCTFTDSSHAGFGAGIFISYSSYVTINNCILWSSDSDDGHKITIEDYSGLFPSTVTVSYSDVQGGQNAVYVDPTCTLNWAAGNIDLNPHFVEGDFHLQSQAGRSNPHVYIDIDLFGDGIINLFDFCGLARSWYQKGLNLPADFDNSGIVDLPDLVLLLDNYLTTYTPGAWVFDDANTSPCIDAGDPNSDWTRELWPHGRLINMGAYGGTPQASMSLSNLGNAADFNLDDVIDWQDLLILLDMWLAEDPLLAEDIDRNGFVNFTDYTIFADIWSWQ